MTTIKKGDITIELPDGVGVEVDGNKITVLPAPVQAPVQFVPYAPQPSQFVPSIFPYNPPNFPPQITYGNPAPQVTTISAVPMTTTIGIPSCGTSGIATSGNVYAFDATFSGQHQN